MYQNPYVNNYTPNYNQQSLSDKIDGQISQLQQMKEQMKHNQQQPAINQTFQLAPQNNGGLRIVNSIEDVERELAIYETPFFNKDYSTLWIKNAKGEIRTFKLKEVIIKDEKDILIENLQEQINKLSNQIKEINNDKSSDERDYELQIEQHNEPVETKSTTRVSTTSSSKSKQK